MSMDKPLCTDEEWDATLDELQTFLVLLADEGLTDEVAQCAARC